MSFRLRAWGPLTCAAAALVAVGISLAASAGNAHPSGSAAAAAATAKPATGTPTAVPAVAPIPRGKPVAIVAGKPISAAAYAALVAQERKGAAIQAQQQGSSPPSERQVRSQALTDIVDTAVIDHYAQQHGITATAREIQQQYTGMETQIEQQAQQAGQPVTFAG